MNLDIFNKLINNGRENNIIQGFIKELGKALDKTISHNNLSDEDRNELSLLQRVQEKEKLTTSYRDKMHVKRNNILNNYAQETLDRGEMYFIYSKNSRKDDTYNLCLCEDGKSNQVIEVAEKDLPKGAGADSVLRIENGEYILDKQGTQDVLEEITEMVKELLEKQTSELKELRSEGHIYEVVEKTGDTVWLMDNTKNDGNCFEEINFNKEALEKAKGGVMYKYTDGEYQIY